MLATRDLDGVFEPECEIYAEAASTAEELGLPQGWLNDGVREEVDVKDLEYLAGHVGLASAAEAIDLVERYYSPYRIRPVTQYLLQDIFSRS